MSIIHNAEELVSLIKKIDDKDLEEKILALQDEILDLSNENQEIQNKHTELLKMLAAQSGLIFKDPFYYAEDDDIPLCPRCWEVELKKIQLTGPLESVGGAVGYRCKSCDTLFYAP